MDGHDFGTLRSGAWPPRVRVAGAVEMTAAVLVQPRSPATADAWTDRLPCRTHRATERSADRGRGRTPGATPRRADLLPVPRPYPGLLPRRGESGTQKARSRVACRTRFRRHRDPCQSGSPRSRQSPTRASGCLATPATHARVVDLGHPRRTQPSKSPADPTASLSRTARRATRVAQLANGTGPPVSCQTRSFDSR